MQCAFAAGTIYLLAAQQAATGRRPAPEAHAAAVADVEEVVGMLREIALSWECAAKVADVFGRLLDAHRRVGVGSGTAGGDGGTGTMSAGGPARKGRLVKKRRGRARGEISIGQHGGCEGGELRDREGLMNPPIVDGREGMDVMMGENGDGIYHQRDHGQGLVAQHGQEQVHAHVHDDVFSSTRESVSPPTLGLQGSFDSGLQSDTDHPLSDTNEYIFPGFGGMYPQQDQVLDPNNRHRHVHTHHAQAQAQTHLHPMHTSGEDFSMSDEEIWTIFAEQFSSTHNGGTGTNPGGMYADWRVTGTGLGMDDGTSFADQPFMTFGPSPFVHPVRETELHPPSDVDVDDEALHNLIATMRQDTFQY